jgi:hypothetical protein
MDKNKRKPKNEAVSPEDELMWAIEFTLDDLAVNREGMLSAEQKIALKRARRRDLWEAIVVILLLGCIAGVALQSESVNERPGVFPLMCLLFALAACLAAIHRRLNIRRDLRDNVVQDWQGNIELKKGSSREFFVRVGKIHLQVTQKIFSALQDGHLYAIYYAPHSKKILSVEWLREG